MSEEKSFDDQPLTPSEAMEFLPIMIKARLPVMLTGSPGQGKSQIMQQVCQLVEADLVTAHPVVDSAIDYKGFPCMIDIKPHGKSNAKATKEAVFLPFGDLKRLIDPEKLTVHFADDLGPAAKMVQAAYGQLLENRAINGHKISDNVIFMAATNRKKDKAGVQGIISMLLDRFYTVKELQNSLNDWSAHANRCKMPHELISWVRYRPQVLDAFKPTVDMSRTPTPRGLFQIGAMMQAGVPASLQRKIFSGTIGKEWATEFIGWLRIYQDMPNPDHIVMNPKDGDIPTEPGHLYALCGALSARATANTFERIITYANRLKDEFSILLVKDAINRDKKLCNCPAFLDWSLEHQDILT